MAEASAIQPTTMAANPSSVNAEKRQPRGPRKDPEQSDIHVD